MERTLIRAFESSRLGTLIAAPFAARHAAEFGAEVIKIEAPDRAIPFANGASCIEGTSLWWYLQSRNKKSICGRT